MNNSEIKEFKDDLGATGLKVFIIDENFDFSTLPPLPKNQSEKGGIK